MPAKPQKEKALAQPRMTRRRRRAKLVLALMANCQRKNSKSNKKRLIKKIREPLVTKERRKVESLVKKRKLLLQNPVAQATSSLDLLLIFGKECFLNASGSVDRNLHKPMQKHSNTWVENVHHLRFILTCLDGQQLQESIRRM